MSVWARVLLWGGITLASSASLYLLYCHFKEKASAPTFVNHLLQLRSIRNSYYVMRHGESEANVRCIISSSPSVAITHHGLTAHGIQQCKTTSIAALLQPAAGPSSSSAGSVSSSVSSASSQTFPPSLHLFTSDYRRAIETATILHSRLRLPPTTHAVAIDQRLRERWFGATLDGASTQNYQLVWNADALQAAAELGVIQHVPTVTLPSCYDFEDAGAVMQRVTAFIADCEQRFSHARIVLVSHGDTCQILLSAAAGFSPYQHRTLPHLANAEIRPVVFDLPAVESGSVNAADSSSSSSTASAAAINGVPGKKRRPKG